MKTSEGQETKVILVVVEGLQKSPGYLEKQLSWKVAPRNGIRIPESGKVVFVESGILGFGIRNKSRNPESH